MSIHRPVHRSVTDSKSFATGFTLRSHGPVDDGLPSNTCANHASPMSRIDGCPECVINTEAPRKTEQLPGETRAYYTCADCGHKWFTSWKEDD